MDGRWPFTAATCPGNLTKCTLAVSSSSSGPAAFTLSPLELSRAGSVPVLLAWLSPGQSLSKSTRTAWLIKEPRGDLPSGIPTVLTPRLPLQSIERGRGSIVQFDGEKESFHILSRVHAEGDSFRLLGIDFDPQLLMHSVARACAQAAG